MKQPFSRFVLAAVVPCIAAMVFAGLSARSAWDDLHRTSHGRVGRMALSSFEQQLGSTVSELAAQAPPYVGADPSIPAIQRAMAGDTVAGLTATEDGAELAVMLRDVTAPDTTQVPVRYAVTPLEPTAPVQVGTTTGYGVSLYLNGTRWGGTDPPPGPERLARALLLDLSAHPGGVPLPDSDGMLQAEDPRPGTPPALVVLASPRSPPAPAVEARILLVLGLLMLFSILTGWIQLGGKPEASRDKSRPVAVLSLALVPVLTTTLFLVHLDRTFEATTEDVSVGDLSRGLAVASALELASSPGGVRLITGFHATLVESGAILESTFNSDPEDIAGLPAPPASFTTSGTVNTPDGPSTYVALRREGGTVIVATTPIPTARIEAFRGVCLRTGATLLAWLLLAGALLMRWSRRAQTATDGPLEWV